MRRISCEFKDSLVYIKATYGTARATQRDPVSNKTKLNPSKQIRVYEYFFWNCITFTKHLFNVEYNSIQIRTRNVCSLQCCGNCSYLLRSYLLCCLSGMLGCLSSFCSVAPYFIDLCLISFSSSCTKTS